MNSMLGYAATLAFTLGCYIVGLSYPNIADDIYTNNLLPKVNLWKEYFLFAMLAPLWTFLNVTIGFYCNFVSENGLKKVVKGLESTIFFYTMLNAALLSLITVAFLYALEAGLDVTGGEAIYYILMVGSSVFCWTRVLVFLKYSVKNYVSEEKKRFIDKMKLHKIKVKSKGIFI